VVAAGDGPRLERLLAIAADRAEDDPWLTNAIAAGVARSTRARARWPEPISVTARPPLLDLLEHAPNETLVGHAPAILRIVNHHDPDRSDEPNRPRQEVWCVGVVIAERDEGRLAAGSRPGRERTLALVRHESERAAGLPGEPWPASPVSPVSSGESLIGSDGGNAGRRGCYRS
jgi:hypothetical protein